MYDVWSNFNSRPRLTAAICFTFAVAIILSLNEMLPRDMPRRHEIGWGVLLFALFLIGVGIAALRGREIFVRAQAVWDRWSVKKRIAIGMALYVGGYAFAFIACHAYDAHGKRWLKLVLPEEIAWWCQ